MQIRFRAEKSVKFMALVRSKPVLAVSPTRSSQNRYALLTVIAINATSFQNLQRMTLVLQSILQLAA